MPLIKPQGFAKPIRVRGGVGEHADTATVSFAHYALMVKQHTLTMQWLRCDQCGGMHIYRDGIGLVEIGEAEHADKTASGTVNTSTKSKTLSRFTRV